MKTKTHETAERAARRKEARQIESTLAKIQRDFDSRIDSMIRTLAALQRTQARELRDLKRDQDKEYKAELKKCKRHEIKLARAARREREALKRRLEILHGRGI